MPFNRLNHSILGEIRPRFALKIAADPEKAMACLEDGFKKDPTVGGVFAKNHLFLKVPESEQHYWSPELSVRIEIEEFTHYTTVSCLVGPRQSVWALWDFIYTSILLVTLFSGFYGWAQYNVDGYSAWLWVIPFGIIGLSTAFIASKVGQHKGRNQMLHLISFVYHELSKIGPVDRLERQ
ncbi:hypothetical protein N9Y60_04095 [Crocinitomicaceae bacterium]|nr:hypothetical protein [Crocinitomicaceae bacterium]